MAQNRGYFLPTTQIIDPSELYKMDINSDKFREFLANLYMQMNNIVLQVNQKPSGYYGTQEFATGETFFPSTSLSSSTSTLPSPRAVFRKVLEVGPLPSAATSPKNVAHGVNFDSGLYVTKILGAATDPVGLTAIPLPYINSVGVSMDSTNIIITAGADYTAYTRAYICLEYIKNA